MVSAFESKVSAKQGASKESLEKDRNLVVVLQRGLSERRGNPLFQP